MPYAVPSPSTSPTATMTFPRSPDARPLRHHIRSHSTDAVPSTSSFIFVQPATPDIKNSTRSNSSSSSLALVTADSTPNEALTVPRKQRIKLFGFTPASPSNEDGPSSQEESSATEQSTADLGGEDATPRPLSFLSGRPPLVPVPGRSAASAQHINNLKDAFPARTTAMVRKKSGELVRSSLKSADSRRAKPRSAPATPISPKFVHFDTQLEHVKHFLAQQRPAAVSRSGSPIETETEDEPEAYPFPVVVPVAGTIKLKLPNFPTRVSNEQDVYVESIEMAADSKSIRGVVRVRNLAFEKWVAVRFTLDHWQTVSEVSAEHLESMGNTSDRFVFNIRLHDLLARIEDKTMFIAVRYTVGGREIWDNNDGQNYRVEFEKVTTVVAATVPSGAPLSRQSAWSVTSAGQAADRMADLKRELSRLVQDDDIGPPSPRKHDTRHWTEGSVAAFATRYDFGASLKQSSSASRTGGVSIPAFGRYASDSASSSGSAAKQASAYFVNGMPATVYNETQARPAPPHSSSSSSSSSVTTPATNTTAPSRGSNVSGGDSNDTSPVTRKCELPPNFGDSYPAHRDYQASSPLYNPAPLFAAPPSQRRTSSPPEDQLKSLYHQYMSSHGGDASGPARFNSFPGGANSASSSRSNSHSMHYAPLLPPSFRDHRRRDSPFASPSGSPQYGSPSMSPAISPAMSPARSPESTSPPRARSPPLYRGLSPPPEAGGWSPASSEDTPSASGSITSNETDATSVPESPLQGSAHARPSGPLEFSSFLDKLTDRYCWTSSHPSSLGLVAVTEMSSPPIPIAFGSNNSDVASSSASTTPRRTTPISSVTSCGGYLASPPSSGSSTPPHSIRLASNEGNASSSSQNHGRLDGFGSALAAQFVS
ncbi:hypothetical protein OIO90_005712 [Microbotryomycetes sp. JL221]|nr:hypothetical protein OIO90_005712 [Microbotryomycetes sp. JL221]